MSHDLQVGSIRKASPKDISQIEQLLMPYVEQSIILPRSQEQLLQYLPNTWVYVIEKKIAAVVSLYAFQENLIEVRGLAVNQNFQKKGLGSHLVSFLMEHIKKNRKNKDPISLFALTYAPPFFQKLGFQIVEKEKFPQKIFEVCQLCDQKNNCKEIAVELLV